MLTQKQREKLEKIRALMISYVVIVYFFGFLYIMNGFMDVYDEYNFENSLHKKALLDKLILNIKKDCLKNRFGFHQENVLSVIDIGLKIIELVCLLILPFPVIVGINKTLDDKKNIEDVATEIKAICWIILIFYFIYLMGRTESNSSYALKLIYLLIACLLSVQLGLANDL